MLYNYTHNYANFRSINNHITLDALKCQTLVACRKALANSTDPDQHAVYRALEKNPDLPPICS